MPQFGRTLLISDCIFTAAPTQQGTFAGYILLEGSEIKAVVPGAVPASLLSSETKVYDYRGSCLTPGLVDPHTHLVFAGSRANELGLKLAGKSYMDIHQMGGGIASTVRATRAASREELLQQALANLELMLKHGTTSAEAKSGYGLDRDTEIRQLELIQELSQRQAVELIPTYMGAHSIPPEYAANKQGYIDFMVTTMLPLLKERKLAEFVDIFCEEGIFSLAESRSIALAAQELGFKIKLHADEIHAMGGAGLAASLQAISCEHLMAIADSDIPKLAESGTVAVLLPATSFFLLSERYAPAKKMLAAGVKVALASDFNPGSSPCPNLQMAMTMACFKYRMEAEDIFRAVTYVAAGAIARQDKLGSLEPGKQADIAVFTAPDLDSVLYHWGVNGIKDVFKAGIRVVGDGQILGGK